LDWEEEMKKFLTFLLAGLLIVAMTAPVLAWEFSMTGQYELRFKYFSRLGSNDLFGYAPAQEGFITPTGGVPGPAAATATPPLIATTDFVGFSGPNIYNRGAVGAAAKDSSNPAISGVATQQIIERGGFSRFGSDAFYSDSRLTFYPSIAVNPAVRVHGVYTVGGFRNKYFQAAGGIGAPPFERYYMSQSSMNAYDTAAIGSWEQFRATIQTPMAIFSVGVKDFPFGLGATFGNDTRSETLLMVVPYGPMRFLGAMWLARNRFVESWGAVPDGTLKNNVFWGMLATYDAGDLSAGAGVIMRNHHANRSSTTGSAFSSGVWPQAGAGVVAGPLGTPAAAFALANITPLTPSSNGLDENDLFWAGFVKYFNGRFFANAEYAWFTIDRYRLGAYTGGNGTAATNAVNAAPSFLQGYHGVAEFGAVCGPTKLSLVYAIASGRDFAKGNITKVDAPWAIGPQFMDPYQTLMFDTYAGGNDGGWNATDVTFMGYEKGMMTDAFAYAARLDYAVAANLNFWASGIWAHRLEKNGFFKGGKTSTGAASTPAQRALHVATWYGGNGSGEFAAGGINPFVDDGYLGWEADAGFDWKLLEGLTFSTRYAYWQPGDWFNQAYMAVVPTVQGGLAGGMSVNNGVLGTRDAIQSIQGSMLINF
jgi:hypothetical protein